MSQFPLSFTDLSGVSLPAEGSQAFADLLSHMLQAALHTVKMLLGRRIKAYGLVYPTPIAVKEDTTVVSTSAVSASCCHNVSLSLY